MGEGVLVVRGLYGKPSRQLIRVEMALPLSIFEIRKAIFHLFQPFWMRDPSILRQEKGTHSSPPKPALLVFPSCKGEHKLNLIHEQFVTSLLFDDDIA